MVAADILQSDLACGFEVAEMTPDVNKAKKAVERLISKLRKQSCGLARRRGLSSESLSL